MRPTEAGAVLAGHARHVLRRLSAAEADLADLVELLENGAVGIALLWDYAWNRADVPDISLTPLLDDPTVLVAAGHRLARKRFTTMSELAEEDWIVRTHDHPVAEVLERSCRAAGFTLKIAFEANDYQEALAMVSVGLGVALAPRTAVRNPIPDVRVLALGTDVPARRVLLAHRQDRLRAPAELVMHQLLVDVAREYQTKA
nr:LysR family transcriptional regulator [uncultured bacterium]